MKEILKTAGSVITKILKITSLNLFKSKRSRLKSFLLQIKMNICFNKLQFKTDADKVFYTATYLRNYAVK